MSLWDSRQNKIVLATAILFILGCLPFSFPSMSQQSYGCPPLPTQFKESDLVGTWVAEYGGGDIDTLVLNDDGTYSQLYNDPLGGMHFETKPQKWSIEQRASGLLRIHMKGMRLCSTIGSICNRENGGVGDSMAVDYCEGKGMNIPEDEVVLIVSGVTERNQPLFPRGIVLRHPRYDDPDAWTYSFHLQK